MKKSATEVPATRALIFYGPGAKAWEDVPDPTLDASTDAIRLTSPPSAGQTSISQKAAYPTWWRSAIIGHDEAGTVSRVGTGVKTLKVDAPPFRHPPLRPRRDDGSPTTSLVEPLKLAPKRSS
jgi:NADPH:quinone reductase-like Zn-dependent oxidoreductase